MYALMSSISTDLNQFRSCLQNLYHSKGRTESFGHPLIAYEKCLVVTTTCPMKWPQTKAVQKIQAEWNQACPLKGSLSFSSDCII